MEAVPIELTMDAVQIELTTGMRIRVLTPNCGPSSVFVTKARSQNGYYNPPTTVRLGRLRGGVYRSSRLSLGMQTELHQRYGTTSYEHLLSRGAAVQDDRGNINVTVRPACVWWREDGRTYEVEVYDVVGPQR